MMQRKGHGRQAACKPILTLMLYSFMSTISQAGILSDEGITGIWYVNGNAYGGTSSADNYYEIRETGMDSGERFLYADGKLMERAEFHIKKIPQEACGAGRAACYEVETRLVFTASDLSGENALARYLSQEGRESLATFKGQILISLEAEQHSLSSDRKEMYWGAESKKPWILRDLNSSKKTASAAAEPGLNICSFSPEAVIFAAIAQGKATRADILLPN